MDNYCTHERTRLEILGPGQEHYARVVCVDCNTTLCFRPHPHNLTQRQHNAVVIQRLLTLQGVSDYNRGFLFGASGQRKLMPHQQSLLNQLEKTHIPKGIEGRNENTHNGVESAEKRLTESERGQPSDYHPSSNGEAKLATA